MAKTCFVIQPFDDGPFDKRYRDILEPAIREAGLEPYRVDLDPRVSIPIEAIEEGIAEASCCVADITIDNPNVWFELGYALASGKQVVLICGSDRTNFPFDVRHRNTLNYGTHSRSDFDALERKLVSRLRSCLSRGKAVQVGSKPHATMDLSLEEKKTLYVLMSLRTSPSHRIAPASLSDEVQLAGCSAYGASVAFDKLNSKGLIIFKVEEGYRENSFEHVNMTQAGVQWCVDNPDLFKSRSEEQIRRPAVNKPLSPEDDDIPF